MWSSLSESRVSAFSAISRIKGIAWNTVARWLEKAAQVCRRFNHRRIAGFAEGDVVDFEAHPVLCQNSALLK